MSNLNITNSQTSNYRTKVSDVAVPNVTLDGVSDQKETSWQNNNWSKQWSYLNKIPDLKTALVLKSIWIMGRGYTCSPQTAVILEHISGWGKSETFEEVLFNQIITSFTSGDSYAEIIYGDDKAKTILNLIPIDPGSISIIVGRDRRIIRYEQNVKSGGKENVIKFEPDEIFHLCHNRFADQIHGTSDIDSLEETILANYESFKDMKQIMHRQARPLLIWKLKTDNAATITAFINKIEEGKKYGEDVFVPDDENVATFEQVSVNVSSVAMMWRDSVRNDFFRAIGLPQIVPGGGGQSTESEAKTIYLAFEQIIEKYQRWVENQIWQQLKLKIELNAPASMQPTLQSDTSKDGSLEATKPSDVNAASME